MSPAKAAESIEMPFQSRTRVGPGNHAFDEGPDPPWEGAILRGKRGVPLQSLGRLCGYLYENSRSDRDPVCIAGLDKLCGVEQRAPSIFGRAAITLVIGPHSSYRPTGGALPPL